MKVGRNSKNSEKQQREAYNNYVSNLLDSSPPRWAFLVLYQVNEKDNVGIPPLKENGIGEAAHDSRKKADLLSEQFKSVFSQEDLENLPSVPQAFPNISQLHFDTIGIPKLLSDLNVKKAAGPDQTPCWVLEIARNSESR